MTSIVAQAAHWQTVAAALLFALWLSPGAAAAQDAAGPTRQELSSAAAAYDRGTAAFVARDFAGAAQWFETAHRLVPSASALVQAVQAHGLAGNHLRSASLALRVLASYGDDDEAVAVARAIVQQAGPELTRIRVTCEGCQLSMDGRLLEHSEIFVQPGEEHLVAGAFDTGAAEERVVGEAGATLEVELVAPDPPPVDPPPVDPPPVDPPPVDPPPVDPPPLVDEPADGLPPWVVIVGGAATGVALGFTIWSGVDTLIAAGEYNDMPTQQRLDDGLAKAGRTHVGIGITAGLGVATLAVALFATDWGGVEAEPQVTATFGISPESGTLGIQGRF